MDWETVSYVFSSELRFKVLVELRKSKLTPSQLARGLSQPMSHVSKALSELSDKELVVCLTPSRKKGRFYEITKDGEKVLDEISKITRGTK